MRWKVLLQCDNGPQDTSTCEIGSIERNDIPEFSQIGLLHWEGKNLLILMQRAIVRDQMRVLSNRLQPCPHCGKRRFIKDYRPRILRTIYANVGLRLPRFKQCDCAESASATSSRYVWYGSQYLPRRSTPELAAMEAALGARVPFREASFLLDSFLPAKKRRNHGTLRNSLLRVGERLDREGATVPTPSEDLVSSRAAVAIDGTFIRSRMTPTPGYRFHVVVGHVTTDRGKPAIFSYVHECRPPVSSLADVWGKLGLGKETKLRIITDGDRGLRTTVQRTVACESSHVLDWFHIAMRLTSIEHSMEPVLHRTQFSNFLIRNEVLELQSIRHPLWHGDIPFVITCLSEMDNRISSLASRQTLETDGGLQSLLRRIAELGAYLAKYFDEPVSYSRAHHDDEPVSTAPAESTINRLVNHRMDKTQQMSWSPRGAHYLLQVRVAILNRVLADSFKRWYPGFSELKYGQPAAAAPP